jgi:hypothetical protein
MTTLTLPPQSQWIVEAKSKAKIQHRVLAEKPKAEVIEFTPKEIKEPDREKFFKGIYWANLSPDARVKL